MNDEPKQFQSWEQLVRAVSLSMPDEYPSGFAEYMAEQMVDEGAAIIDPK